MAREVVPKVAIVSDALLQRGGGERVVEALAEAFPDAPIFALLYSAETGPASIADRVIPSWLNAFPFAKTKHRAFLPFYRSAIEAFDLGAYDVIVSSHHTVGKGALTRADQINICYCHTPMRALWERSVAEISTLPSLARPLVAGLFSHLRSWDVTSSSRVQHYIANSTTTRKRIATYYRRSSTIIHPPIDTDFFTPGGAVGDYYLIASRPVPYKRVDLALEAARRLDRRVLVVGGHHSMPNAPKNAEFQGVVSDERLRELMRGARALLFPQLEDFGMTPLEVNACGRPVIAYGAGGALDTVVDGVTGVFAAEQSVESFQAAIERFEGMAFSQDVLREHALHFSRDKFISSMQSIVEKSWREKDSMASGD